MRRYRLIAILFFILLHIFSTAYAQKPFWLNTIGATLNLSNIDLKTDKHNNNYLAGTFYSTPIDMDPGPGVANLSAGSAAFIAKYDVDGNYIWAKSLAEGIVNSSIILKGFAMDKTGNIIIAGEFEGSRDFDPGAGIANHSAGAIGKAIFLAKYDNNGNYLWSHDFAYTPLGNNTVQNVVTDNAGNIIVTGELTGSIIPYNPYDSVDFDPGAGKHVLLAFGQSSTYVAKYNSLGQFVFAEKFGEINVNVSPRSMIIDKNANIYLMCDFADSIDIDFSSNNLWVRPDTRYSYNEVLIKYDSNFNPKWYKKYGGQYQNMVLATDNDLNLYMATTFVDSLDVNPGATPNVIKTRSTYGAGLLAKYDSLGIIKWVEKFDDSSNPGVSCRFNDIDIDSNFNIYACGIFNGDLDMDRSPDTNILRKIGNNNCFVSMFDTSGILAWSNTAGSDYGTQSEIQYGANGSFFYMASSSGTGGFDYDFTRNNLYSDPGINILRYYTCSGEIMDTPITCHGANDGILKMDFKGYTGWPEYDWSNGDTTARTSNLSPGTYSINVTSPNGCIITETITITEPPAAALTLTGDTLTSVTTGITYRWINCVTHDTIAGDTERTFIPKKTGDYAVVVIGNICVDTSQCISVVPTGVKSIENEQLIISPNPATDIIKVSFGKTISDGELRICDMSGRQVYCVRLNSITESKLNISSLNNGIYMLTVMDDNNNLYREKIIKE